MQSPEFEDAGEEFKKGQTAEYLDAEYLDADGVDGMAGTSGDEDASTSSLNSFRPRDSAKRNRETELFIRTSLTGSGSKRLSAPGSPREEPMYEGLKRVSLSGSGTGEERPPPSTLQVLSATAVGAVKGVKSIVRKISIWIDKIQNDEPFNIQVPQLAMAILWAIVTFNLFLVKLLRPRPWWFVFFTFQGTLLGLLASFLYYNNKKRKAEINHVLGSNLGLKGLNFLIGGLPSWLSYTEREKVRWLNRTLEEVWPFYDRGLSKMIKKMVEETFEQTLKVSKVPGVKHIGFKHLTFGDAPFRVESIYVNDRHGEDKAMVMEMDIRWCGDANISLAIEFSLGDLPKMCPGVTDIKFAGSLRIVLQPLVNDIPGFGAAIVTFRKPPQLSYSLNFGKLLGGISGAVAKIVTPFIDYVINGIIVNMMVWPQRLVIPILNTEEMQYEIERLMFRPQGIMKVDVMRAQKLPTADVVGSSDAFVELTTDGKHVASTRVIPDSLNPEWMETHYLLVHEPAREHMKVSVYDRDAFSPLELFKFNFKDVLESKEFLGRCLINVLPITSREGQPYERWYDLGKGEWSRVGGCGKGRGQLQLSCVFQSFKALKPMDPGEERMGILIFKLTHGHDLPRAIGGGMKMTAYAEVRCGKQREMLTPIVSDKDHHWNNLNNAHFHGVRSTSTATVVILDKTTGVDEPVGNVDISVPEVVANYDFNPLSRMHEAHLMTRSFKLSNARSGWITARVRFVPYF